MVTFRAWNLFTTLRRVLAFSCVVLFLFVVVFLFRGAREFRFTPSIIVRGLVHCDASEAKINLHRFSSEYPCDIFTTPVPPSKDGLTVVTFVNSGWVEIARNWILSAIGNGLEGSLYLIAMETGVCEHFTDVPCYHHSPSEIGAAEFGDNTYQRFMIARTKLILHLLSCPNTKKLMLADADLVFLTNPLPTMDEEMGDNDLIAQRDSTGVQVMDNIAFFVFDYICGGLIYLKVNNATKLLYQSMLQFQVSFHWNDQAAINVCMRHYSLDLKWSLFSKRFASGKDFFEFRTSPNNTVLVHANFKKSYMDKIGSMMSRAVWFYDAVGPELCKSYWTEACEDESLPPLAWCDEFRFQCEQRYQIHL